MEEVWITDTINKHALEPCFIYIYIVLLKNCPPQSGNSKPGPIKWILNTPIHNRKIISIGKDGFGVSTERPLRFGRRHKVPYISPQSYNRIRYPSWFSQSLPWALL